MRKPMLSFIRETGVYTISVIATKFIGFLLYPIYTRSLSKSDVGTISLILSLISLLNGLAQMAMDTAANRWYWETEETPDRKATFSTWHWSYLANSSVAALLLIVLAPLIRETMHGGERFEFYLRLAALSMPLSVFGNVLCCWYRTQRLPKPVFWYSVLTSALQLILTWVFVKDRHWGLTGIYLIQIGVGLISVVTSLVLMKDWLNPRWFSKQRFRTMLEFSLPLIPTSLLFWIVLFLDRWILARYISLDEVGIFQIAILVANFMQIVTSAIQAAWPPFALSIAQTENARRIYADALLLAVALMCSCSAGLSLFSREAILVISTPGYLAAVKVVPVLLIGQVFMGMGNMVTGLILMKKTHHFLIGAILMALLSVVLNFTLIPHYGILGAGLSNAAAASVIPAYYFYASQKIYSVPYNFWKVALMSLLFVGVTVACNTYEGPANWASFLIRGALFCIMTVIFFGLTINRESWQTLSGFVRSRKTGA